MVIFFFLFYNIKGTVSPFETIFNLALLRFLKAMKMLSDNSGSIPHIFLITDGSVDDERNICQLVETQVANGRNLSPRISSFGLGNPPFCKIIKRF